jgi:hypothetical protein
MLKMLPDLQALLDIAKTGMDWIKYEHTHSLRVDCLNHTGIHTTSIYATNMVQKLSRGIQEKKKYRTTDISNIKVYSHSPFPKCVPGAVYESGENEITLDLSKVGTDTDLISIEETYNMEGRWFDGLIYTRSSPEDLEEETRWTLSAQLIDTDILSKGFSEIDISDFPVTASIFIQENINTNLPSYLKQISEIDKQILSITNPRETHRIQFLINQKNILMRKAKAGTLQEKLQNLMSFLQPKRFKDYIHMDSSKDFRDPRCVWGGMFSAYEAISLPTHIDVITRTDLNYNKPASHGVMTYDSNKFADKVRKILT